jgi:hypothetical protein
MDCQLDPKRHQRAPLPDLVFVRHTYLCYLFDQLATENKAGLRDFWRCSETFGGVVVAGCGE